MTLEEEVAKLLIQKRKTLVLAESCSGGMLSNRLTNVPGSSKFLLASVVSYSNLAKTKVLKVPAKLIKSYGAVSKEVACAMAKGAKKIFKSDLAIGITGIAGPGGGSKEKPVGLTFIAVASENKVEVNKCLFKGSRLEIKAQATTCALKLLLKPAGK